MRMTFVLVALALLLTACGSSRVVREGGAAQAGASTPRPGQTLTVKRGDTVYRLAVNNGISPLDLATWNNIAPPYTIYPGQRLRLYPSGGGSTASTPSRPASTASRPSGTPATTPPPVPAPASTHTGPWVACAAARCSSSSDLSSESASPVTGSPPEPRRHRSDRRTSAR